MVDKVELVSLYHLARVAMNNPSRHDRMRYALNEYCLANAVRLVVAGVTRAQVYKVLCSAVSN